MLLGGMCTRKNEVNCRLTYRRQWVLASQATGGQNPTTDSRAPRPTVSGRFQLISRIEEPNSRFQSSTWPLKRQSRETFGTSIGEKTFSSKAFNFPLKPSFRILNIRDAISTYAIILMLVERPLPIRWCRPKERRLRPSKRLCHKKEAFNTSLALKGRLREFASSSPKN
ncbi:hypothetical protein M9H77_36421 [Catharanthus roseus]|uniref:Uncharacterized protein n=1 Tax=Catharanthus roseus TaxID=4058 RepID=A0ACB9ZT27_CATRO|nr:hypothetical protein M9H77_36421 [Catharanthus roseus]